VHRRTGRPQDDLQLGRLRQRLIRPGPRLQRRPQGLSRPRRLSPPREDGDTHRPRRRGETRLIRQGRDHVDGDRLRRRYQDQGHREETAVGDPELRRGRRPPHGAGAGEDPVRPQRSGLHLAEGVPGEPHIRHKLPPLRIRGEDRRRGRLAGHGGIQWTPHGRRQEALHKVQGEGTRKGVRDHGRLHEALADVQDDPRRHRGRPRPQGGGEDSPRRRRGDPGPAAHPRNVHHRKPRRRRQLLQDVPVQPPIHRGGRPHRREGDRSPVHQGADSRQGRPRPREEDQGEARRGPRRHLPRPVQADNHRGQDEERQGYQESSPEPLRRPQEHPRRRRPIREVQALGRAEPHRGAGEGYPRRRLEAGQAQQPIGAH